MNTQQLNLKHLIVVAAFLIPGLASAGEGQTLGLTLTNPLVDSSPQLDLECGYNSETDTLTLQSKADAIEFTAGGNTAVIFNINDPTGNTQGGLFEIVVEIDSVTGDLLGGTFSVIGVFFDGILYGTTNPLLTGNVIDYGIVDGGENDDTDFLVNDLSGDLLLHPSWPAGVTELGIQASLQNSSYSYIDGEASGFGSAWSCASSKATAGPLPVVVTGEGACTKGFWKNHTAQWPVDTLTLGSIVYSQDELLDILGSKSGGDRSIQLASQLIAAKLNIAGGSSDSCISAQITAADDWLDTYAPGGVPGDVRDWFGQESIHDDLDSFNNGGEECARFCTR